MLSLSLIQSITHVVILTGLAIAVITPIYWLIFAWLLPQSIINRYLVETHFSGTEVGIYCQMPGKLMFSAFCVWVLFLPNFLGKRRNMHDVWLHMPTWYKVLSIGFFIQAIIIFSFIAAIGFLALDLALNHE